MGRWGTGSMNWYHTDSFSKEVKKKRQQKSSFHPPARLCSARTGGAAASVVFPGRMAAGGSS